MYAPVTKHRYKYTIATYFNVNSNRGDADSGYNDSHHAGVVVLMPCLVHELRGRRDMSQVCLVAR